MYWVRSSGVLNQSLQFYSNWAGPLYLQSEKYFTITLQGISSFVFCPALWGKLQHSHRSVLFEMNVTEVLISVMIFPTCVTNKLETTRTEDHKMGRTSKNYYSDRVNCSSCSPNPRFLLPIYPQTPLWTLFRFPSVSSLLSSSLPLVFPIYLLSLCNSSWGIQEDWESCWYPPSSSMR